MLIIKERTVRANYIYNMLYVVSSILFPLITFPYAARVLGADGIGLIGFFQSLINYVCAIFCVGIPLYGIREIAKVKMEPTELSKSLVEIIILHGILTLGAIIVIIILSIISEETKGSVAVLCVMSIHVLLYPLGCEWFYKGIEEFKYIAIRSVFIRILSAVFLFVFVRTSQDVIYYAICVVLSTGGNFVINFIRIWGYVDKKAVKVREIRPFKHFKRSGKVYFFNLALSSFPSVDVAILGLLGGTIFVGYYTGAIKFVLAIITVVASLAHVLLPRLSHFYASGRYAEFNELSQMSIDYVFVTCPFITLILMVLSPELIAFFCGSGFQPSVSILRIMAPIVMTMTLVKIIGMEILFPQNREKMVTYALMISTLTEITLCYFLFYVWSYNGVALATLISNIIALLILVLCGKKNLTLRLTKQHLFYFIFALLSTLFCYFIKNLISGTPLFKVFVVVFLGLTCYGIMLYAIKDEYALMMKTAILNKKKIY